MAFPPYTPTGNPPPTIFPSAVKSGFYWGYAGLIDNVIKLIIKQTNKPFKIILTRGLANLFKNTIKGKIEVKKDLTLNGLLKVAKNLK